MHAVIVSMAKKIVWFCFKRMGSAASFLATYSRLNVVNMGHLQKNMLKAAY